MQFSDLTKNCFIYLAQADSQPWYGKEQDIARDKGLIMYVEELYLQYLSLCLAR